MCCASIRRSTPIAKPSSATRSAARESPPPRPSPDWSRRSACRRGCARSASGRISSILSPGSRCTIAGSKEPAQDRRPDGREGPARSRLVVLSVRSPERAEASLRPAEIDRHRAADGFRAAAFPPAFRSIPDAAGKKTGRGLFLGSLRMPLTDRFDLPLTTRSAAAVGHYVEAVDLLLSANAGADALLERALASDPDFALARAARARLHQLAACPHAAAAEIAAARALAPRLSPRERGHIAAIGLAIDGDAAAALAQVEAQIAEYPRDARPLSLALGVYGLLGFSGRRDHHQAQRALLEGLAADWGEDWWFLAYLGWARIETGALAEGIPLVERALALNPRNAHAAHARAHGYHEAGDAGGGASFLAAWRRGYDPASQLYGHISWHLALFELACGNAEEAAAIYRDSLRPHAVQGAPLPSLADAASFLWRWRLYDAAPSLDAEWAEVAAHARRHFPRAGLAFADLHAALAAAAARGACRRERSCRRSAPRSAPLPVAHRARRRRSSKKRCPICRASAAVMRSANCSRIR